MNSEDISKALGIELIKSSYMESRIKKWCDMYTDNAAWLGERIESLKLPSAIAAEFSRLILTEFSSSINDEFLDKEYQKFIKKLPNAVEIACALGGVLFKPYVSGNGIFTDVVRPYDFYPVSYDNDMITAVICPENVIIGKNSYTRLEYHSYDNINHTYEVHNICFRSDNPLTLGNRCSLSDVPKWAELKEYQSLENVEYPLFCHFRMPFANNIDMKSPLGISVFSKAEDLIRQADKHWERIQWEFESSERAIDAAEDIFRMKNGKPELPKGRERMFRTYSIGVDESKPFIETFSPEIRDVSLINGLNSILRRIEFNVGLAYGTLSDVSDVEKTAEEIKISKHRSYENISSIQNNLRSALEQLVYCYGYYAEYFKLGSFGELTCTFGDSVLEDTEKEYQRRLQMVSAGILSKEQFLSWYFGCLVEETAKYMPLQSDLFSSKGV